LAGVATGVIVAAIGLGVVSVRQDFFSTSGHISCSECQGLLPQFVSNDLSSELAARVQRHLSDCAHCQAAYDAMRSTVSQQRRPGGKSTPRQLVAMPDRHFEAL
jgi:predicted anti-sigma-YlaC factor YlaD